MFCLIYHACPTPEHSQCKSIGGAFVSCWIERATIGEADAVARQSIADELWNIDKLEEAYPVDRSNYDEGVDGLEYYEQALIDREVFVFHRYPIDDRNE